jgi:ligand-binding SRPBCC domain-containing protein
MPLIQLETRIYAPASVCFNLSRDINLHMDSMVHTDEKAIAGTTTGLIGLDETVTWRARHLGCYHQMTVKITAMEPYCYFEDTMVKGPFKKICHRHFFTGENGFTIMKDEFEFETPYGIIGKLVNVLLLTNYMTNLLVNRNRAIQQKAEKMCF